MIFGAILFWAIIIMDLVLLKRRDSELFKTCFSFSLLHGGAVCVALLFLIWFSKLTGQTGRLPVLMMVFLLTIYLTCRIHFYYKLSRKGIRMDFADSRLSMLSDTCGLVLFWIAGMIIFAVLIEVLAPIMPFSDAPLGRTVLVALFSSGFMLWLIYRISRFYPGCRYHDLLGLRTNRQSGWRLWVIPLATGILFAWVSAWIMMSRAHQPSTPFHNMLASTESFGILFAFFIMAVLLAPFFEEVIFRGFFFYVLSRLKGKVFAVGIIAAVFALLHYDQYWGDWVAIAAVTALGLVLTVLRAWTGSSIPSIVTHYAFNFGMTVIPLIMVLVSNPLYFEYQVRFFQLTDPQKEELLLKSIDTHPDHDPSYNDLAWLYAEQGRNLGQALDLVNRALNHDPQNYAYLDTKAEILQQLGRLKEAWEIEQELIKRYPSDPRRQDQMTKIKKALYLEE